MFIIILAETIIVFGTNHPVLLLFDPSYQQNLADLSNINVLFAERDTWTKVLLAMQISPTLFETAIIIILWKC